MRRTTGICPELLLEHRPKPYSSGTQPCTVLNSEKRQNTGLKTSPRDWGKKWAADKAEVYKVWERTARRPTGRQLTSYLLLHTNLYRGEGGKGCNNRILIYNTGCYPGHPNLLFSINVLSICSFKPTGQNTGPMVLGFVISPAETGEGIGWPLLPFSLVYCSAAVCCR